MVYFVLAVLTELRGFLALLMTMQIAGCTTPLGTTGRIGERASISCVPVARGFTKASLLIKQIGIILARWNNTGAGLYMSKRQLNDRGDSGRWWWMMTRLFP
jgi:hypothetical protein